MRVKVGWRKQAGLNGQILDVAKHWSFQVDDFKSCDFFFFLFQMKDFY